jgi:CheY-like chemotaxis protein
MPTAPAEVRIRATLRPVPTSMSLLSIRLLGELSAVDHRGNSLSIGNRRTQAVIAFLALSMEGERTVRDFSALFGGTDPQLAAPALMRDLQYALRFIPPDLLRHDRGSVRFKPEIVQVDALRFAALAGSESLVSIRAAADLYRGPLMPGFVSGIDAFDSWLDVERQRYAQEGVAVFSKLLSAQIKAGWWEAAVETASRLLALDPSQEVVHRTLMRLQLEQGRPDSALRRYQECADILRRELDRQPTAETERVHGEIVAALRKTPAPREVFRKPLDRPVLVLLVEDDMVSAALMEGFLAEAGYEVVSVVNGAEALMQIGSRRYDLLIIDINIPTVDGHTLFEAITRSGVDTPAIFITGSVAPEDEARSLELGAADFLRKPIRRETLLPRIRAILQRRERARQAR